MRSEIWNMSVETFFRLSMLCCFPYGLFSFASIHSTRKILRKDSKTNLNLGNGLFITWVTTRKHFLYVHSWEWYMASVALLITLSLLQLLLLFYFECFCFSTKKPRTHSSLIYYFIICIMYYIIILYQTRLDFFIIILFYFPFTFRNLDGFMSHLLF